MRILIGCEESGTVRSAFIALGHDAWSNDLVAARDGGPHLQMCVLEAIINHGPWDIIILHPDCTALSLAGNSTYGVGKPKHYLRIAAIEWTKHLWETAKKYAKVGCALENPASMIWKFIGTPQWIQPWQFGHPEKKKTGILVHNLPRLVETNNVYEIMIKLPKKLQERNHYMSPGPNRKRDRSKTYAGIADAFANQWGK